jgi:dTDP-4-dehydrorhamnose 3,5-epimerase
MELIATELAEVLFVRPVARTDDRGEVRFVWNEVEWSRAGLPSVFMLENHITSRQWVLRGVHRQMSVPQGKLVRCLIGRVFDVAVDLRQESASFGRWVGRELGARGGEALWIPPGFGHGLLALTEGAVISIQATAASVLGDERTLAWDDRDVGVGWPLPSGLQPVLSARDQNGAPLASFRQPDRSATR